MYIGGIMKIKSIVNPQFFHSLNKVVHSDLPVSLAWKLKGVIKYLDENKGSYEEMRKDLLKKHGELDDKGELKTTENGQVNFKDDKSRDAFIKDHEALLDQDLELATKINIKDLGNIKLSVSDLLVLEDLISE